jgi:UrcA family protein
MIRFLAAAAALAALVATTAQAETPKEVQTRVQIDYRDLDVSQPKGARTLLKRIDLAAANLCRQATPKARSAGDVRAYNACRQRVADQLVIATGKPLVLALHRGEARPSALAQR